MLDGVQLIGITGEDGDDGVGGEGAVEECGGVEIADVEYFVTADVIGASEFGRHAHGRSADVEDVLLWKDLVAAIYEERVFGHADGDPDVVAAYEFHGDEAANGFDGFEEEVDARLGDGGEFDVEPAALGGAGDAGEEGVLGTR